MIVRKSSWHYWLYKTSFEHTAYSHKPTNLCPYFWRVVAGGSKVLIVAAFAAAILFIIGWCFYTHTAWSIAATVLITAIVAASSFQDEIRNFFSSTENEGEVAETPEPGLIRSWLKAKKDKVCPVIELVE